MAVTKTHPKYTDGIDEVIMKIKKSKKKKFRVLYI